MLDLAVTLMVLGTLVAYVWSAKAHFRSDRLEAGAKLIAMMVFAMAALIAWLTWTVEQRPAVQLAGLSLQVIAFAVFWLAIRATRKARLLAAFTDANPETLVTTGPYRYVRHPFYTSYIVFWFGGALATGVWWMFVLAFGMLGIYWRAAQGEEARFAATALADEYAAFKKGRARFLPGIL
ncbi:MULTISPECIES: isoprenylcysteine carboxylmethyltransferase family protein [unclassified Roseitalea]|uniref:methyltransferase family protein n=1 Tax=unclassified Roseitalea TaxID=2639107 RepID=UPI00273D89C8|nr:MULTISPECIES: isoprenylcysteine carboxylmethyltransferase family protein [unclassified Roseitalea]